MYAEAAQTLLDFVALDPTSASATDYLMGAARIYERDDRFEEAIKTWTRVAEEYPGDSQSATAIFFAGVTDYRLGDFQGALAAFDKSLSLSQSPQNQARAHLWLGKTQLKLGNSSLAVAAWQKGQALDPDGYYSDRARDLLMERAPFESSRQTNLTFDLKSERKDADAWMRLTFNLPTGADLNGLDALAEDARLSRGMEYWELGLYDEARLEFESLREAVSVSAVDSYRLGNYLLELGLYRSAVFAFRQTLTLAGLDDHAKSMMAPSYFSRVRYGLYYSDLIAQYAQAEGFDPLFLFSVVRQESMFEGFIHSSAGARGLMQIIPSTGATIAGQLGWPPNYSDEDLYRPDVSVRLGTHYLATNRELFDMDLYAALAAYNSGPGNAVIWKEIAGDDPDLFLEVVRFEETRNYIRNIYEIYSIYKRLYGTSIIP
jgi:soluble lytic murein transglycosylase